ncbi:MAG: hypothetical protein Q9226_005009 [Calogaya cf. arnoldii]
MTTPQKRPASSEQEAEPEKKPKLPDVKPFFLYDRIVTILVGPQSERFKIHQNLVCQYPFFRAAYEGAFQESEGVLKLPEHDPDVVRFFVYWLYSGKLTAYYSSPSTTPSISELLADTEAEQKALSLLGTNPGSKLTCDDSKVQYLYTVACYRDTPFDSLVNLFLLADYLQIPCLKDEVVKRLVETYGSAYHVRDGYTTQFWAWSDEDRPSWAPNPIPSINIAWNSQPRDSPLCLLLVALFVDNGMNPGGVQEYTDLDPSFLCAAFLELQQRLQGTKSLTERLNLTRTLMEPLSNFMLRRWQGRRRSSNQQQNLGQVMAGGSHLNNVKIGICLHCREGKMIARIWSWYDGLD